MPPLQLLRDELSEIQLHLQEAAQSEIHHGGFHFQRLKKGSAPPGQRRGAQKGRLPLVVGLPVPRPLPGGAWQGGGSGPGCTRAVDSACLAALPGLRPAPDLPLQISPSSQLMKQGWQLQELAVLVLVPRKCSLGHFQLALRAPFFLAPLG